MRIRGVSICILIFLWLAVSPQSPAGAQTLKAENEALFEELQRVHGLSNSQMESLRTIFKDSGYIGQGNPAVTRHPVTPQR